MFIKWLRNLRGHKKKPQRIIYTEADDAFWVDISTPQDTATGCERYLFMFAQEEYLEALFTFTGNLAKIAVRRIGLDQTSIPVEDWRELCGCLIQVFAIRDFSLSPLSFSYMIFPLLEDIASRRSSS